MSPRRGSRFRGQSLNTRRHVRGSSRTPTLRSATSRPWCIEIQPPLETTQNTTDDRRLDFYKPYCRLCVYQLCPLSPVRRTIAPSWGYLQFSVDLLDLHLSSLEVMPFFTFNSLVSLPPQPATKTDKVSPSANMAIALVVLNFFIFAPFIQLIIMVLLLFLYFLLLSLRLQHLSQHHLRLFRWPLQPSQRLRHHPWLQQR